VKFIKFILCLSIILFAFPAASEIYKYVDENGGIHFTDDFSKVPVEQRPAINAGVEYEDDSDTEQAAETGVPYGTDEDITDDSAEEFTDDSEYQDEVYDSADTADDEQIDVLGEDPENETDLMASSDDAEAENDLDAIRSQLEVMKKEIDGEYQDLVKEKEQLAKEKKSLKGQEDIEKHNKKVKHLDKKIETYAKKGKLYETRVEAYNEWVRQENTKVKKKTETP
jgi:hypothetical protein